MLEVRQSFLERTEIFLRECLLVRAALHLERTHGGDQYGRLRIQPARAALDVEELLGAEVRAEARLRHDDIRERERGARREDAVAAVRDVAERAGVHERGTSFERLHEVRADGILQQHRHRARRIEVARAHRRLVLAGGGSDDDAAEPLFEIGTARRERDDRHDLARRNDDPMLFAHDAVRGAAEPDHRMAQRAIVHVDRARPGDAPRIEPGRVSLL